MFKEFIMGFTVLDKQQQNIARKFAILVGLLFNQIIVEPRVHN